MRTIIHPYKIGSASAKLLSAGLNALRVRSVGRYTPRRNDFVINWGASTIPRWYETLWGKLVSNNAVLINKPEAIANASNKLRTFNILSIADVAIPEFTTNVWSVRNWDNFFVRNILTVHSGAGIEVVDRANYSWTTTAPLYVKAIENHGEYRVHIVNGKVIDYQKKRRQREDIPNEEQSAIRNLANGWIYTRNDLRRLERIESLAVRAVNALGLDFGAVDIIKDENGDVFVLEVNTAPGLYGTTLENYITAFRELINNYNN